MSYPMKAIKIISIKKDINGGKVVSGKSLKLNHQYRNKIQQSSDGKFIMLISLI